MNWSNPNAPVTVSIAYTPTPDELKYPENIVVWYIDGQNNPVSVPSGRYDAATGRVTFEVDHFSKYAVAFSYKAFSDQTSVAGYARASAALIMYRIYNK